MSANIIQYLPQLLRKLKSIRGSKKIVFTNGCFDILHRGHVEYLHKARMCGDVLVVGLNSDTSVRRLKGPARPVVPLGDRATVLAALQYVDFVIPFSDDTPLKLIQAIRPDVLVKGADWKEENIVGAELVRSYGGHVARVQLTPGRSTSSLIDVIRAMPRTGHPHTDETPQVLIVIPARYASSRFPGKPLADLGGKPVLQHVHEKAVAAIGTIADWKVVIATDDKRILKAARDFGAQSLMTSRTCKSGSDRCAEVTQYFPSHSIVVNLQGDEPFQAPANIKLAVNALTSSSCPVSTLAVECAAKDIQNPGVTKVAVSKDRAIYFSRSPIPFYRDAKPGDQTQVYKHLGLYVFRRSFLLEYSKWPATALEQAEKLEQLRILENDHPIAVAVTPYDSIGIDTPADLARARRLLLASQNR